MAETRAQREARLRANMIPRRGRRSATPPVTPPARRGSSSVVRVGRVRRQRTPDLSPTPSPPPRASRRRSPSRHSRRGTLTPSPRPAGVRSPSRQQGRRVPSSPRPVGRRRLRSPSSSVPVRRNGRSRSPVRRRPRTPSAGTLGRKLLEVDALKRKLEKMECIKKEREWLNKGIRKQAEFAIEIREYHEELSVRLEMEYGPVSDSLKEFIKNGESKVHNRIHLLRVADKYGWAGATDFQEEELARDDKEEKKLKMIRKEYEV